MKNATGYYCEQHKRFNKISNFQTDSNISKHGDNCFPDLGIINGMMTTGYNNNILSNNAADIESSLFGIGSTNLVEKKPDVNPSVNKLKHCKTKWHQKCVKFNQSKKATDDKYAKYIQFDKNTK
mgnify:CR=1 FL=1